MGALMFLAWMLLLSMPLPLDNPTTVSVPSTGTGQESGISRPEHQQQDAVKSGFTIRSSTELVTVDAIVRTEAGGFVGSLQADDFIVYDNGVAQDITLFSRERLPIAVALVVDRSPSVQQYLAQLRTAALTTLDRLQPEDQVALFSFDMEVAQLSELTQDRRSIARLVNLVPGGNGTNIYDALFGASRYLRSQASNRRRAIILISDNWHTSGSDHNDRDTLQELLENSAILYGIETPGNNSVGGVGFRDPARIARIAKETGGEVLKAATANSLVEALDSALSNLKTGYVLGFSPSDKGEEGSYHSLLVGSNAAGRCPKCQVQARTGYYAGPRVGPGSTAGVPTPPRVSGTASTTVSPSGVSPFVHSAEMEEAIAQHAIANARSQKWDLLDIAFEARVAVERDAAGNPQTKIELLIDAANVMFRLAGGRHVGRLRITAFYMNPNGKSLGSDWRIMDLRLTEATYQQMMQKGIPYSTTIPLKDPDQRIKVVIYDPGSAKTGSRLLQIK